MNGKRLRFENLIICTDFLFGVFGFLFEVFDGDI
jgi:hypothetical protein